jgi:putative MFS transporter
MLTTDASGAAYGKPNNYFDGIPVSRFHKCIFFIIMMAYFFEQMDNWNFGFIAPAIFRSWNLSDSESTMAMAHIVFWYFIGMTAGGFFGGVIADRIGRRKTFLFAMLLFSGCSIINGLPIDSLPLFIAARSLTGFGVFCLMVCSQAYIAEMSPAESRGKWQGMVAAVGFCAVPVIALVCRMIVPLSPQAWRWIFYFGGIGFIGLAVACQYLPESPRWLVSCGRRAEAEAIVRRITGRNIDLAAAAGAASARGNAAQTLRGMFTRRYLGRTLLLFLVFSCVTPAGFTFTVWTGKLLAAIPAADPISGQALSDLSGNLVVLYDQVTMLTIMTVISLGVPAGCWLASLISDRGGRKLPLAAMYVLAACACPLFAFFSAGPRLAALCGFLLSAFNMAGGFILFSYAAESYPTRMRSTAVGVHNGLSRLAVSAFQYAIPGILAAFGRGAGPAHTDMTAIFFTCAVLYLFPVPFILALGKKTGGKSLEDIS